MLLTLFILPIEKLINRYLALDSESFTRLQKLSGKALTIELTGLNLRFHLLICGRGIQCCEQLSHAASAYISGTPLILTRLLLSPDPIQLIRAGEVTIEGDMDLVQELQSILRNLKIDWEEQLSYYIGDTPATQLGACLKGLQKWQQETSQTCYQDFSEYLQEEIRYLPPRAEIADFSHDVMELALAADRLAARILRLERLAKEHR